MTEKYIKIPFDKGVVWEVGAFHKALRFVIYNSRVILDVGSHIGSFVVACKFYQAGYGSRKPNDECKIICFEPQKKMYDLLLENITQNNYKNVIAYNKAVGDTNSKVCLSDTILDEVYDYNDEKEYNYGGIQIGEGSNSVEMITIDSLGLDCCDLIKMDVESFEFFSICGAEETIKKFRPVIFYEDIEGTKPTDYMLSIISEKTKQKYHEFDGDIIKLLESFGYNHFEKWGANYLAKFDVFKTKTEIVNCQ